MSALKLYFYMTRKIFQICILNSFAPREGWVWNYLGSGAGGGEVSTTNK